MKNTATAAQASWAEALRRFDRDLQRRGAAERTRRAYGGDVGELATWAAAQGIEPAAMTYRVLRGYAARLSDRGAAPRTLARKLASSRAFFRSMVEHEDMAANPADLLPAPKRPQPLPRTIKASDVATLLDRIPATTPLELRDRAMFELACSRGLRAEQLVRLDLRCVELDPREPALRAVARYLERGRVALAGGSEEDALFISKTGRRLSASDVRRRLRVWARHAAVQGPTVRGSKSTTQVYTRVESARLRAAYERSHPRA